MFKVYNKSALTKNQRFTNALIYGIPAALGLGLAYGFIVSVIHIEFSIVFVGIGYLIGKIVQEAGRGVQVRFSVLGAVLALVSFLISDLISTYGFLVFLYPWFAFRALFIMLISWFNIMSINGLLGLAFRAGGIYFAYINSRAVR